MRRGSFAAPEQVVQVQHTALVFLLVHFITVNPSLTLVGISPSVPSVLDGSLGIPGPIAGNYSSFTCASHGSMKDTPFQAGTDISALTLVVC